jgi:hypothetical protein
MHPQFKHTTANDIKRCALNNIQNVAVRENGNCFISTEELACEVTKELSILQVEYDDLLSIVRNVIKSFYKSVGINTMATDVSK